MVLELLRWFTHLCGLSEDEFRVFHQTLQWHSHVNDLCPLVPSAVVRHKLAVPGVEDDEPWLNEAAARIVRINWKFDVTVESFESCVPAISATEPVSFLRLVC